MKLRVASLRLFTIVTNVSIQLNSIGTSPRRRNELFCALEKGNLGTHVRAKLLDSDFQS